MITQQPYVFYRSLSKDEFEDIVVVGLDLEKGKKELEVSRIHEDGTKLHDAYSNQDVEVVNGKVILESEYSIVLLEEINK